MIGNPEAYDSVLYLANFCFRARIPYTRGAECRGQTSAKDWKCSQLRVLHWTRNNMIISFETHSKSR